MSEIDVTRVLSQIRALQSQTSAQPRVTGTTTTDSTPAFGRVMEAALDRVSIAQGTANDLQTKFQLGEGNTDLASVMLASSRAQVEFKGLVEVRNRMVRAYQDILNMPL